MQQFQLSIPEPCHQSWQGMTPTQQGRFCSACAKEVVDFSMMTDDEVLNYFNNKKDDNVCGRVLPSQLERAIAPSHLPVKKRFWYWHYITLLFLFFSKTGQAKPQGGIAITPLDKKLLTTSAQRLLFGAAGTNKTGANKIIAGKISDENGRGIPFATVKVKGTNHAVAADAYGVYSIKVNTETAVLELYATGYSNKLFVLSGLNTFNFTLTKSAHDDIVVMAGMMIRRPVQKKVQEAIQEIRIAGKITDEAGNAIANASVKVKNSSKGTSADSTGAFSLLTGYSDTEIECSAVGYTPKTILASDIKTTGVIVLAQATVQTLQPVIVNTYPATGLICRVGGISVVRQKQVRSLPDTLKAVFSFKKSSVNIYPNPVTRGQSFNVSLRSKSMGNYTIQVSNTAGSIVLKQAQQLHSKSETVSLLAENSWSKGMYFISLFDSAGKLISTQSFSVL